MLGSSVWPEEYRLQKGSCSCSAAQAGLPDAAGSCKRGDGCCCCCCSCLTLGISSMLVWGWGHIEALFPLTCGPGARSADVRWHSALERFRHEQQVCADYKPGF